jgi:hypothetical protein
MAEISLGQSGAKRIHGYRAKMKSEAIVVKTGLFKRIPAIAPEEALSCSKQQKTFLGRSKGFLGQRRKLQRATRIW